jgi:hypothetical protein
MTKKHYYGDRDKNPEPRDLPGPEDKLPGPEDRITEKELYKESRLSNHAYAGEAYSPMDIFSWVDSRVGLISKGKEVLHRNVLKVLIDDSPGLRQRLIGAMETEIELKAHGQDPSQARVILDEVLADIKDVKI